MAGEKIDLPFGVRVAKRITDSDKDEWTSVFMDLRKSRQLSRAIREMNELEFSPVHGTLVRKAFERMGLSRHA